MERTLRLDTAANRCFVCGPGNEHGLQLTFRLDGDICRSEWTSTEKYMGYDGVTHGGILFCLMDDVMANHLFLRGEICVTARADIRFRQTLPIGSRLQLESRVVRRRMNLAVIEGIGIRDDGEAIVESTGHFVIKKRI